MRETRQKQIILEELRKVKTHPDASELYLAVKKRASNMSLGTVYRNLELFHHQGNIAMISCNNFNRFDGNAKPHPHFICIKCQKVFDIEQPLNLRFDLKLFENRTGNKVCETVVEIDGYCKNCKGVKK